MRGASQQIMTWGLRRTRAWELSLLSGGALALGFLMSGCYEARRLEYPDPAARAEQGSSQAPSAMTSDRPPFKGEGLSLGESSLRRLTRAQIERSLIDAFGEGLVVPQVAEPDVAEGGLLSVGAGSSSLSARGISSLEEAAYSVAQQVLSEPSLSARAVPCELEPDAAACQREALSLSGRRLWRRPLTEAELEGLMSVVSLATERLNDPREGLGFGLATLIQSPHFLYRAELGLEGEARTPLDPYALAARLSFLLWDSGPDDELLDAARDERLLSDEGLKAQAERLLASPRARVGLGQLFTEQLKLYELGALRKDPLIFEHYNAQLMREAGEETLKLLLHLIFDERGDFRELMTMERSFLSPKLAALYQVPAPLQEGFKLVRFPEGSRRAGLLSHASILSLNAHPSSSSATLRGKFVRTVLLCQTIPPPPVGVDTAIPEPSGEALTLRDRVAEHLENPSCAGCHQLLDPIGLGLENYDSLGQWRERDNGALIDASGELDARSFEDPRSLGLLVREHPSFGPCVVRTLARYATGRVETEEEQPFLDELSARFEEGGFRYLPLVLSLVMSPLFREAGAPR